MKPTPTKPTAPRMPRARVMHEYTSGAQYAKPLPGTHPVALVPFNTGNQKRDAQQARKLAAFWNLTEEERVERLAESMLPSNNLPLTDAKRVLAAINGGP